MTGGAGLQGSRLAKALVAKGYDVTVADNFSRGRMKNLHEIGDKIDIVYDDLREYGECVRVTKRMDGVYHLAAHLGGVEYTHGSRDMAPHGSSMAADNLIIDTNMIKAASINAVERYLYPSTACIYPLELQMKPDVPPLKEEDAYPANCESPYGWAKLMGEILCQTYARETGIKVAIVRLFNIYGEGEDPSPGSHVVPELMRKALLCPKQRFTIFGDGSQTRAFTYVDNAVEAMILALEKYAVADPVNIGSPERVSILELAKKILALAGKNPEIQLDGSKPVGAVGRCPDISKARKVLGWEPKMSLDEGLLSTWDHFEQNYRKTLGG